ncbi:MAG: DinB family protein [Ferruginibacter sp.]
MTSDITLNAPAVYPCMLIFKLNQRLFLNCLDGVTEEQSTERISEHSNHFIWIATHTLWARYNTINLLGSTVDNPYKGMFEGFKPYDKKDVYPSLKTVKEQWESVSALLIDAFQSVTEEHLAAEGPFKNPIGDNSIGGTIIFLAQHESYDIGQMGYLKKYLTKEAMKY